MTLLLDDNLIDELPCILGLVPELQNVTFRGNLLSSPPQDILDLGWKGIKQYFQQHLQFTSTCDNSFDNMKVWIFNTKHKYNFLLANSTFPYTQVILQRNIQKSEVHRSRKFFFIGSENERATLPKGSSTDEEVINEKKKKKRVREGFIKYLSKNKPLKIRGEILLYL